MTAADEARFWSKVSLQPTATGCWEWLGALRLGYGQLWVGGKTQSAHRLAWEWANGLVPDDLYVLHKCDVPPCVNPLHLFLGTPADNARDRNAKGRARGATGDANGSRTHPEKVPRGAANGSAKLTSDKVLKIRARWKAGGVTYAALARQFGVGTVTAWKIVRRKTWAHT